MISSRSSPQAGVIRWLPSLVMMAGAIAGGYGMMNFAQAHAALVIRRGILAWAICLRLTRSGNIS